MATACKLVSQLTGLGEQGKAPVRQLVAAAEVAKSASRLADLGNAAEVVMQTAELTPQLSKLLGVVFGCMFGGNRDWRIWDYLLGPKDDE